MPAAARIVFELELERWHDWAENLEVFGADRVDDDDDDLLEREVRAASNSGLMADLKVDPATVARPDEDVGPVVTFGDDLADAGADARAEAEAAERSYFPRGGEIAGTTAAGVRFRETPTTMELEVDLPRAAKDARAVRVDFGATSLAAFLDGERVAGGALEGAIDPDEASWCLSERRDVLEVVLVKRPGDDAWARPFAPPAAPTAEAAP